MIHRHLKSLAVAIFAAGIAGCGASSGSSDSTIRQSPDDWSKVAGKTNTFEGSAGNSAKGPLLRLEDGRTIGLTNFRMWPVTYVSRPVGIVGTVISGEGMRTGEYVIAVERYYLVQKAVDTNAAGDDGPIIEEPVLPTAKAKKPAKK